jgi:FkbM family methyltransferase
MVGRSGEVIAVDAHPATFAALERLCQLNRLSNVELMQVAVTDSNRPAVISDLPAEHSSKNRLVESGIEVHAVTITDLVSKFNLDRIDFLKMNIEGAEVAALRGARDVLPLIRNAAILFAMPRSGAMTSSRTYRATSRTGPRTPCVPYWSRQGST